MGIDRALLTWVVSLRAPWLDALMVAVSAAAQGGAPWLALAAVGAFSSPRRPAAWRLVLSMALTYLVVDWAVKPLVGRARPFEVVSGLQLLGAIPSGASFPSGHAARAFAGALAGRQVFPALGRVLWVGAVVVSLSRVSVGAHWPSDVLAGAAVGLACAWFVTGGPSRDVP